jgi:UDP-N-acetylmuramoyl-L-alanyl-D-glutamate--2,6-diaminopimelate ligase
MSGRVEIPRERRLDEVVARLEAEGLLMAVPGSDLALTGVADDSRRVRPGDLFCAWQGTAVDSHTFIPAAEAAGAVAALVERPVEGSGLAQVVVRDGRLAAAHAAALLYGDPAESLLLAGVTGTNGKTTTVWLLRHLLEGRYRTASLGTLGVVPAGGGWSPGGETLTTPGPVEFAALLRTLADDGVEAVALEVSSHALEQARVHGVRFSAAIFTNLTRDHLDYHGTLEAYLAAKRSLVDLLGEGGVAVVNREDPAWVGLGEAAPRAVGFALAPPADIWVEELVFGPFGARFRLATPEGTVPTELPLLGSFNVQNALGAAAAALALGIPLAEVAERLATAPQVPGRLEKIAESPCPVLRDYAHTPDALERLLSAVRPLVEGRLIVVFGAGGDRDHGKRPLMGSVAERLADLAIVTSDNPRTEDPEAIVDEIVAGMARGEYRRVINRRDAIALALREAAPGDLVLLAGKGHETYQIVGAEKYPFDELEVVRELLQGRDPEVRV